MGRKLASWINRRTWMKSEWLFISVLVSSVKRNIHNERWINSDFPWYFETMGDDHTTGLTKRPGKWPSSVSGSDYLFDLLTHVFLNWIAQNHPRFLKFVSRWAADPLRKKGSITRRKFIVSKWISFSFQYFALGWFLRQNCPTNIPSIMMVLWVKSLIFIPRDQIFFEMLFYELARLRPYSSLTCLNFCYFFCKK